MGGSRRGGGITTGLSELGRRRVGSWLAHGGARVEGKTDAAEAEKAWGDLLERCP